MAGQSVAMLVLVTVWSTAGDMLGNMVLTPSWDLSFSLGETLVMDCGVYTAGDPSNFTLYWHHPSGSVISNDKDSR